LVENLTTEKFDPGQYSDTYAKELEKLIEAKSKGQEIALKQEEEEPEETTDILEALKASLKVKAKPQRRRQQLKLRERWVWQ
jgi:DNA end-binding protein Ku